MRRLASILSVLAASVILSGSTLLAAEKEMGRDQGGKDVCLLVSMSCVQSVDSIQMRIERLDREIRRGADVYSREELNQLKRDLEDAKRNLESLTTGS